MNIPTAKKKQWITPEIVDLDVQNTNSGGLTVTNETAYPSPTSSICAPSS